MFATLDNLEKELKIEIKTLEDKWDKEPKNDYHFHEICGVRIAMKVVERFKSKELLELDKWVQAFETRTKEGETLSD